MLSAGEIKRVGSDILPLRYLNALVSQSISVLLVEAAQKGVNIKPYAQEKFIPFKPATKMSSAER